MDTLFSTLFDALGLVWGLALQLPGRLLLWARGVAGVGPRVVAQFRALTGRARAVFDAHLSLRRIHASLALIASLLSWWCMPFAAIGVPMGAAAVVAGPSLRRDRFPRAAGGAALAIGGLVAGWMGLILGVIAWSLTH